MVPGPLLRMPREDIIFYGVPRQHSGVRDRRVTDDDPVAPLLVLVLPVSVAVDPLPTPNPSPPLSVLVLPVSSAVDPGDADTI